MRRIKVRVRHGYEVMVGKNLLKDCGKYINLTDRRTSLLCFSIRR